ncbi:ABC transporter substrate-binding protein [Reinekea sp. G2M2-21]|uniref:substrate-binding periplasmic protein n=1 Tax=Reinekea sp. G2M2-21 TaxID=2788942 RepID=UPI0018A8A83C|nr:transporter substrate-binding domain-containing protein [Reinekea sp. G2M2-21]
MQIKKMFAALMMLGSVFASEWPLTIYSEQYPPFNYVDENGQARGAAYDLLILILDDLQRPDLSRAIQFVPWARGYREAQVSPNTLLFTMVRNESREKMFQWVGPVFETSHALIGSRAFAATLPSPLSLIDLTAYSVGVVKNDIGELLIEQSNVRFARIESVSFPVQAAKMLEQERIELWSYGFDAARFIMSEGGVDPDDFQMIYRMKDNSALYYAFSLQTPRDIVLSFQDALERMKIPDPKTDLSPLESIKLKYKLADFLNEQ